ncbi:MAG: WD40/YVTN/BNR-like repeat-containing protein [Candidatus Dormibacteria bacterium]
MKLARVAMARRLAAAGLLVLAFSAAALALAPGAAAATPFWVPLGGPTFPAAEHVTIWQLVANPAKPQDLLAATGRGVFASSDGGQHWTPSAITGWTWTVAFSNDGRIAYAGTQSNGLYRSTDSGLTWTKDNAGLLNLDVRAIAIGSNAVVVGTNSGVYLSGTGLGWDPAGLRGTTVSSLAIIAASPLGVLAGSDGAIAATNLFLNLAVGSSKAWQAVPGADPQGTPVFAVGVGPLAKGASHPPILVGNLKGLFLSTNGASSWQQVNLGQGVLWSVNTIAFDPENPAVVYVGGDNGGSSGGGVQRSVNGGATWGPWQAGLPASDVTGLAVEPTSPVTVLAALWHGTTREPATARMVDTSAPGPVPLQAVGATSPIAISPPPSAAPTPTPGPRRHPVTGAGISIPAWGPPVVVAVLLVLIVATVMGLRRRRIRLDAEAPP